MTKIGMYWNLEEVPVVISVLRNWDIATKGKQAICVCLQNWLCSNCSWFSCTPLTEKNNNEEKVVCLSLYLLLPDLWWINSKYCAAILAYESQNTFRFSRACNESTRIVFGGSRTEGMNRNKGTPAAGSEGISAWDDRTPDHNPYQTLQRALACEVCPQGYTLHPVPRPLPLIDVCTFVIESRSNNVLSSAASAVISLVILQRQFPLHSNSRNQRDNLNRLLTASYVVYVCICRHILYFAAIHGVTKDVCMCVYYSL